MQMYRSDTGHNFGMNSFCYYVAHNISYPIQLLSSFNLKTMRNLCMLTEFPGSIVV
jgi:hypothetical protein